MALRDLSTKCKRSVATPTLQASLRLRGQGTARLHVSEPGINLPRLLGSRFCLSCSRRDRGWALPSSRDSLSFQKRQVTGQRASLVPSFSGRGQGGCLQGQSSSGQRGRVKGGGVRVSHVGGAVWNWGGHSPWVLAGPSVGPRPPWNACPSPGPTVHVFSVTVLSLEGAHTSQKRPCMHTLDTSSVLSYLAIPQASLPSAHGLSPRQRLPVRGPEDCYPWGNLPHPQSLPHPHFQE